MSHKLVEAPAPNNGVYCRWCDNQWVLLKDTLLCIHCDTGRCAEYTNQCTDCGRVRQRTDNRQLGEGVA